MVAVYKPQEGSRRQVLKRPGWLIAQRIRWESERGTRSRVTQQPHLCYSPCISLIPTCCHLRNHRYLPVTVSFAFKLYPSRSLSNTHPFLLRCVCCDLNAGAAPFSYPYLYPPSSNGFLAEDGEVQAYRLLPIQSHSPELECALLDQSCAEQKWSHLFEIKDGAELGVYGLNSGGGSSCFLLIYSLSSLSAEWQQVGRQRIELFGQVLFPLLCFCHGCAKKHQFATNLIF